MEQDNGAPSQQTTVQVDIDLLDVQDSGPRFLNAPLSLLVYENAAEVGDPLVHKNEPMLICYSDCTAKCTVITYRKMYPLNI